MSIWNLLSNTVEGALEATINAGKAVVGVAVVPIDGGETIEEAIDGVQEGLSKVGDSTARPVPSTSADSEERDCP